MIYQDALLYGKKENRVQVNTALGVPDSLPDLDDDQKLVPHISIYQGVLYHWVVDTQVWEIYVLPGGNLFRVDFDVVVEDEYVLPAGFMIDKISFKPENEQTAAKIGLTDGGTEILLLDSDIPLEAGKRDAVTMDIIAEDDPVTIYFRNWVGSVNIKLWVRKIS